MNAQPRAAAIFVIATFLCLVIGFRAHAQTPSGSQKETVVTNLATGHATGTFEVKVTPQTSDDSSQDAMLGRMSLDKQFHGDLQGASKGQMLTAGPPSRAPPAMWPSSASAVCCMAAVELSSSSTPAR